MAFPSTGKVIQNQIECMFHRWIWTTSFSILTKGYMNKNTKEKQLFWFPWHIWCSLVTDQVSKGKFNVLFVLLNHFLTELNSVVVDLIKVKWLKWLHGSLWKKASDANQICDVKNCSKNLENFANLGSKYPMGNINSPFPFQIDQKDKIFIFMHQVYDFKYQLFLPKLIPGFAPNLLQINSVFVAGMPWNLNLSSNFDC